MFEFGAGTLWGFPVGGNTAANPTPMKFGTLQDVSLDISGDVKQLYGQKQFPEAVARGNARSPASQSLPPSMAKCSMTCSSARRCPPA